MLGTVSEHDWKIRHRSLGQAIREHDRAWTHVAVVGSFLLGVMCVVGWGRSAMDEQTRRVELKAFAALNEGEHDRCWELVKELQRRDPTSANAQYLGGLIAYAQGGDGYPMIVQAANWGSGLAVGWLRERGEPCTRASGGGTARTGN
jgi:hypothetical protein